MEYNHKTNNLFNCRMRIVWDCLCYEWQQGQQRTKEQFNMSLSDHLSATLMQLVGNRSQVTSPDPGPKMLVVVTVKVVA